MLPYLELIYSPNSPSLLVQWLTIPTLTPATQVRSQAQALSHLVVFFLGFKTSHPKTNSSKHQLIQSWDESSKNLETSHPIFQGLRQVIQNVVYWLSVIFICVYVLKLKHKKQQRKKQYFSTLFYFDSITRLFFEQH